MPHFASLLQYIPQFPLAEFVSLQFLEELSVVPDGSGALVEGKAGLGHHHDFG